MDIAANATAKPVHKGPAVTSAQTNLTIFQAIDYTAKTACRKVYIWRFLNFKMLPDMIFLLTLFHVVIKLCYVSRVALI